jgi:hypothetical protein
MTIPAAMLEAVHKATNYAFDADTLRRILKPALEWQRKKEGKA